MNTEVANEALSRRNGELRVGFEALVEAYGTDEFEAVLERSRNLLDEVAPTDTRYSVVSKLCRSAIALANGEADAAEQVCEYAKALDGFTDDRIATANANGRGGYVMTDEHKAKIKAGRAKRYADKREKAVT